MAKWVTQGAHRRRTATAASSWTMLVPNWRGSTALVQYRRLHRSRGREGVGFGYAALAWIGGGIAVAGCVNRISVPRGWHGRPLDMPRWRPAPVSCNIHSSGAAQKQGEAGVVRSYAIEREIGVSGDA